MTKFNRKANILYWSEIQNKIHELELDIVSPILSLTDVQHKNNIHDLKELRHIDDILENTIGSDYSEAYATLKKPYSTLLIKSNFFAYYEAERLMCKMKADNCKSIFSAHSRLKTSFNFSFKNLDQYLVDYDYLDIQVFGETYYY